MFATNFLLKSDTLSYVRGEDKITKFAKTDTIATGHTMTNHFCSVCGSLMYRVSSGFPEVTILRLGQVDDFEKHETVLKPRIEQFAGTRATWLKPAVGVEQQQGNYYVGDSKS